MKIKNKKVYKNNKIKWKEFCIKEEALTYSRLYILREKLKQTVIKLKSTFRKVLARKWC